MISIYILFFQRQRKRDGENITVRAILKRVIARQHATIAEYKELLRHIYSKNKTLHEEVAKLKMENATLTASLENECALTIIFEENTENIA